MPFAKPVCENCPYWGRLNSKASWPDSPRGECRAQSPTTNAQTAAAVWPVTRHDDWCACHPDREVKR